MLTKRIEGLSALQGAYEIRRLLQGIVGTSEHPSYDSVVMYSIDVWPLGNTKSDDDPTISVRRETRNIEGAILFRLSRKAAKVAAARGMDKLYEVDTTKEILELTLMDAKMSEETATQTISYPIKQLERAHERAFITRLADNLAVALGTVKADSESTEEVRYFVTVIDQLGDVIKFVGEEMVTFDANSTITGNAPSRTLAYRLKMHGRHMIEVQERDLPYLKKPDVTVYGETEFRKVESGVDRYVYKREGRHGSIERSAYMNHSTDELSGYRWCKPKTATESK